MRVGCTSAIAGAVVALALAGGASAATLWTPSLPPDGANKLRCDFQNIGSQRIDVVIEILDYDGDVVASLDNWAPPGGSTAMTAAAADHPRACRFRFRGSKRKVRASGCVYEVGVGCIAAVAAE